MPELPNKICFLVSSFSVSCVRPAEPEVLREGTMPLGYNDLERFSTVEEYLPPKLSCVLHKWGLVNLLHEVIVLILHIFHKVRILISELQGHQLSATVAGKKVI